MKITSIIFHPYQIPLTTGQARSAVLIQLIGEEGESGWGEVAPLPKWSQETFDQAFNQLVEIKPILLSKEWTEETCVNSLQHLSLYPSVQFGLESAFLSLLDPLPAFTIPTSALLMGSPEEIMEQAEHRLSEGFTSAKLKVGGLSFGEAKELIDQLKDQLYLRIDVNRAWDTADSLQFFSQFSKEDLDYVEEPFRNPEELHLFRHPLAIDESFPRDLSLKKLEGLPTLKALIYKPTIQGGMSGCFPLRTWTEKKGISLVLSSSFESEIGLAQVAALAHRCTLASPVGIGTYHHLLDMPEGNSLRFSPYHAPSQVEYTRILSSRLNKDT